MKKFLAIIALVSMSLTANATLISESFTGNFADDEARFYVTFDVTQNNTLVNLLSLGYAGGVNAEGTVIADGGFDTQLFIFNSSSTLLDSDDDASNVASASSSSGSSWDALIDIVLNIGSYTVALTQYDSDFISGDLISGDWSVTGTNNFFDNNGDSRTSAYAFDISGENLANIRPVGHNTVPTPVTEPTTLAIFALTLVGLAGRRKFSK